jgi:hypothetical protein
MTKLKNLEIYTVEERELYTKRFKVALAYYRPQKEACLRVFSIKDRIKLLFIGQIEFKHIELEKC